MDNLSPTKKRMFYSKLSLFHGSEAVRLEEKIERYREKILEHKRLAARYENLFNECDDADKKDESNDR